MSDEQKIEELIQALGNGEWHPSGSHVDGQSQTIDQLVKMGRSVVLSVRKALSHENEKIRFGAVCVLGWMRPEIGVEPPITTILNDKDCRVRSQAAFWLGAYRDERAIPALILGLNDRQGYFSVGPRATDILLSLGKRAVDPILQALQKVNVPLVPDLENQDSMLFFARLVWLLGEIGDKRAEETLLPYVNHQNQLIRQWTSDALRKLGYAPDAHR